MSNDWNVLSPTEKFRTALGEITRLRAALAKAERERDEMRAARNETSRMFHILNGMDIDHWDKRAEHLMQTTLDGLHICETNRLTVKGILAEHFANIGTRVERAEAELAAAQRRIAEQDDRIAELAHGQARAALRSATETKDEPT